MLLSHDVDLLRHKFLAFARPDGDRCTLESRGQTTALSMQGYHLVPKFKSNLPPHSVFDAIYCKPIDTFFIVDCYKLNKVSLCQYPLEMRLHLIKDIASDRVKVINYVPLTKSNLLRLFYGPILSNYTGDLQKDL